METLLQGPFAGIANRLKTDLENLSSLENRKNKPIMGGIYSDDFINGFNVEYEKLLDRFNSYKITDATPSLKRLNNLKTEMDGVVQYKEQFLSQYEKVKIMPSTTPDTTFLENGIEKE